MAFTTANPVTVGEPTKKTEYDAVFGNTQENRFRTMTAGAGGITAYDVVYLSAADTVLKAKADAAATMPAIGIAPADIAAAAQGSIQFHGPITNGSWTWTPGTDKYLYVSATVAGGLTATKPTGANFAQPVAEVLTATTIKIIIGEPLQDASASLRGLLSSAYWTTFNNKFDTRGTAIVGTGTTVAADVGTAANKLVQLDANAKLPAVDGSQLTNLPAPGITSAIGTFTISATGNVSVTGLPFQPSLVQLDYMPQQSAGAPWWHPGRGIAKSSTNRWAWALRIGTQAEQASESTARIITVLIDDTFGEGLYADFVSMNPDGFTINVTRFNTLATATIRYLAIK